MSLDIVNNLRIVEDSLSFILLTIIGTYFIHAILKLKGVPIRFIPIGVMIAFIPLYFWKTLGGFRRIFVDPELSPVLFNSLHNIAEVFEGLSGLIIAISIILMYFKIKAMTSTHR